MINKLLTRATICKAESDFFCDDVNEKCTNCKRCYKWLGVSGSCTRLGDYGSEIWWLGIESQLLLICNNKKFYAWAQI